jgi:lysophospholipase L1-like esterase
LASIRHLVFRLVLLAMGCVLAYMLGEALLALQGSPATPTETGAAPEPTAPVQAAAWAYHSTPWYFAFPSRSVDMQATVEGFAWEPDTAARANSHGFRTPEYTIARPADTFRVVVIGDSITWGQGVEPAETFASQLQDRLQDLARSGITAEVIATGVCGSRISDAYIRLRAHVEQLQPDVVVIQYFPNDPEYLVSYRRRKPLAPLEEHSNLLRAVRIAVERDRFWDLVELYTDPERIEWKIFSDVLAALAAWRQKTSTPVLFVAFPPFDQRRDGGNMDGYRELEPFRDLLRRPLDAITAHGFPVLDLLETYRTRAGRTFLCVSEQDGHPNALAHSLAADALYSFLKQGPWLPASRADLRPGDPRWAEERRLRDAAHGRWSELNQSYAAQRELFAALLELHPSNPWLIEQMANLSQNAGDHRRACDLLRSLADLAPEIAAPWYHISLCTDDGEEGLRALERMLEVVPDHAPTVEELMKRHAAAGRTVDACACAVELGRLARYPEQFTRARAYFESSSCEDHGLDFWE